MEAVGLVASILTLISATNGTVTALTRLWRLRDNPDYLRPALNELNDFTAFLQSVHTTIKLAEDTLDDDVRAELGRLLGRAQSEIETFREFIDGLFDRTDTLKFTRRAKMKEVLGENKKRMDAFRSDLISLKCSLNGLLAVTNTRYMPRVLVAIQQISVVSAGNNMAALPSIENNAQPRIILEQLASADPPALSSQSLSQRPRRRTTKPDYRKKNPSYVVFQAKPIAGTCSPHCLCQCHAPLQGSTPRWLQGLAGTLFFNFTGTLLLNRRACNDPKCRRQLVGQGAVHLQYIFPTWMLSRTIQLTGTWQDLRSAGATWCLRIPRVIDNINLYAEIWTTVTSRPIENFQHLLDNAMINPTDLLIGSDRRPWMIFEIALTYSREDICLMLLSNGVDLDHQNAKGLTLAQYFWQYFWEIATQCPTALGHLRQYRGIQDSLEQMRYTIFHKIVLGLSDSDLDAELRLGPGSIDLQDCFGKTPLHYAAYSGDAHALEVLLNAGADVHVRDNNGDFALHLAAFYPSKICCDLLLQAGANVLAMNNNGQNSLYAACRSYYSSIGFIESLLELGVDPNSAEKNTGRTCLMNAARVGRMDICMLLLDFGADIEALDHLQRSAIVHAVLENRSSIVRLLCDKGAVLNRLDKKPNSIVHWAARYGGIEVMQILSEQQIDGLGMGNKDVKEYRWSMEHDRKIFYKGPREPYKEVEAAFQAMLDSIIPLEKLQPSSNADKLKVPGAFPADADVAEESADLSEAKDEDEDSREDEDKLYTDQYNSLFGIKDEELPNLGGRNASDLEDDPLGSLVEFGDTLERHDKSSSLLWPS